MSNQSAILDTLLLAKKGLVEVRESDLGYAFFPVGGQTGQRFLRRAEPAIIDGDFKEVPPEPSSDSRALTVYGASQPADNLQGTLAAANRARQSSGMRVPAGVAAALSASFVADPDGDDTPAALAGAINANTAAVQAAGARAAHERERQRVAVEKAAKEAASIAEERARKDDMHAAIRMMLGMDREPRTETMESRALIPQTQWNTSGGHELGHRLPDPVLSQTEPEPPDDPEEDEPLFDPDEIPTDLEIMRDARREQRRQAEHPAYGPDDFETSIDEDTGRTVVKPKLKAATFEELLLLSKVRRAESAVKAAKAAPGSRSPNSVDRFLAKSRTAAIPNDGAKPRAPSSPWDWVRRHFGTPAKGTWK